MAASRQASHSPLIGLLCVAFAGLFALELLGLLPGEPDASRVLVPTSVGWVTVFTVAASGLAVAFPPRAVPRLVGVGGMLAGLGGLAGWVAIGSAPGRIQGGLPFLTPSFNELLARLLFGSGALLAAWLLVLLVRRSAAGLETGRSG